MGGQLLQAPTRLLARYPVADSSGELSKHEGIRRWHCRCLHYIVTPPVSGRVSANLGPGTTASKLKRPQKPKATRVAQCGNPLSCVSAPATANPPATFGGIGCPFWSWHQRLPLMLQLVLQCLPIIFQTSPSLTSIPPPFAFCCYSISVCLLLFIPATGPSNLRGFFQLF